MITPSALVMLGEVFDGDELEQLSPLNIWSTEELLAGKAIPELGVNPIIVGTSVRNRLFNKKYPDLSSTTDVKFLELQQHMKLFDYLDEVIAESTNDESDFEDKHNDATYFGNDYEDSIEVDYGSEDSVETVVDDDEDIELPTRLSAAEFEALTVSSPGEEEPEVSLASSSESVEKFSDVFKPPYISTYYVPRARASLFKLDAEYASPVYTSAELREAVHSYFSRK